MLPIEVLFVYCYVMVDDAIKDTVIDIPTRCGPPPACTDAEVLTIALVRHVLGRRSEAGFLAEVACNWPGLFPVLPAQSEFNRRVRWLYGAFEQLRCWLAGQVPADDWQQIDTLALPVKHPSRVRGPDGWVGPAGLVARYGRDAAHAEWFYGFRLAICTDLGSRIVRAWAIVPAALNERDAATDLLNGIPSPTGLLLDKSFNGHQFTAEQAKHGTAVLIPPTRKQRKTRPAWLRKVIAEWRNRIDTSLGEITDRLALAHHGAHTFWGLLTRTAATLAAHTLLRLNPKQPT